MWPVGLCLASHSVSFSKLLLWGKAIYLGHCSNSPNEIQPGDREIMVLIYAAVVNCEVNCNKDDAVMSQVKKEKKETKEK